MNKIKNENQYTVQIIFVLILALLNYIGQSEFYGHIYSQVIGFMDTLIIIYFIFTSSNKNSYHNSKKVKMQFLYAIVSTELFQILVYYVAKNLEDVNVAEKVLINFIFLVSFIIFLKFYKINKNQFSYKLDKNMIVLSLSIGCTYLLVNTICGYIMGAQIQNKNIILNVLTNFLVVAFIEETTYRGLLIDFLHSLNMPFYLANIIQSLLFGIAHIINLPVINGITILSLSYQALFGLLAGYLVYQKKSLMPGMIIHTFNNIAFYTF